MFNPATLAHVQRRRETMMDSVCRTAGVTVLSAILLAACGGGSASEGPSVESLAAAVSAEPGASVGRSGDDPPSEPAAAEGTQTDGSKAAAPASATVRGTTYEYPEVSFCRVTDTSLDLSASSVDGMDIITVQGEVASPQEVLISVTSLPDFAIGYAAVNSGEVDPPEIIVDGSSVEIAAQLTPGDGSFEPVTIRARCGE